jgi:gamma-glutamyltranspeptidase / glutathione hydrolase
MFPTHVIRRWSCLGIPALLLPLFADAVTPPGRDQAGSMTVSRYGVVASSQTLASEAGASVLARGGNAVDAAIAANAVLGVIEPMMNGMGGDLFAIVYEAKTKKLYGLNASGWAPRGMTIEALKAKGISNRIPGDSVYSVTVPGAVAGWDALHRRFAKLTLLDDLQPAIFYAEKGVPIPETDAINWRQDAQPYAQEPTFGPTFLPGGKPLGTGEVFRDPDLAASLRAVGSKGRDGFYRGAIAESIVKLEAERGGFMDAADLADFKPEWVDPVSTTYQGWTVWEIPPNTQGIAALSMLNMMEQFPLRQWGHDSANTLHVEIEAKKLAYADMLHYVGDPAVSQIPTEQLISKSLAKARSALIEDHAQCNVLPSVLTDQVSRLSSDTTYLAVVDSEGNEVSLIQSNSNDFGSGLVPPGTGFVLQDRGTGFTLQPGQPNSLAPHKRPLHTIIPGFMQKDNFSIAFGIMGGLNQAQAHAQFVSNVVDFDMNIQAALDAARFGKRSFNGCDVPIENGFPTAALEALSSKGHLLQIMPRYSQLMGRGNAVMHDANSGVNFGASDPRADGQAVPEEPPIFKK